MYTASPVSPDISTASGEGNRGTRQGGGVSKDDGLIGVGQRLPGGEIDASCNRQTGYTLKRLYGRCGFRPEQAVDIQGRDALVFLCQGAQGALDAFNIPALVLHVGFQMVGILIHVAAS